MCFPLAGSLDQTIGGPDLDPQTGLRSPRRSLYFRHAKEKRVTFLRLFDSPDVLSCYRRSESVAPQQALALANSSLCREQSRVLAGRLDRGPAASDPSVFITAAFQRILGRAPTSEERAACAEFLQAQARQLANPKP